TRILRLSEQSAYRRITAARAARRYPRLLDFLEDGSLTLTSIGLLAAQLTPDIADALMDAARFKTTREVERLIATTFPQPDVPTHIRACYRPRPAMASSGVGLFEPPSELANSLEVTEPPAPPSAVRAQADLHSRPSTA